jgi:hypothetical protein
MQLCQNASTIGRVSIPAGAPSSRDTAQRKVGPINRIARNPTQVISQSKNLRHKLYDPPGVDASLVTGDVAAALTPAIVPSRVERTLVSAALDLDSVAARLAEHRTHARNTASQSPAIGCNLILQS